VLGSALELRRSQVETYARVMREQGDVVRLAIGPPGLRLDLYCVFHPDGVREVLAGSRDGFTKRNRFYVQIAEALGWGLLTTEGARWQHQRRLIQPLFTRKQIAGYAELMAEEATGVAGRWEVTARSGAGVDANGEMVRLTLRVVGRSIFGDDVERAVPVLDSAFPVLNRRTCPRSGRCEPKSYRGRTPGDNARVTKEVPAAAADGIIAARLRLRYNNSTRSKGRGRRCAF
jgi:cytochrome P450